MALPVQRIEGVIDFIQYPRNGFTKPMEFAVVHVRTDTGRRIKAAGEMIPCKRGEVFWFEGYMRRDKYGETFRFERAGRSGQGEQGARSYLAHLFGPKTAEKIIAHFGGAEDALAAFKRDPYEVTAVKGISTKTVQKAVRRHQDHEVVEVLFTTLKPYGLTMHMALKIYKKYGSGSLDRLKENPYILMYDFDAFDFHAADLIASYFNIHPHDQNRLEAGVFHAMMRALSEGHVFLPLDALIRQAVRTLNARQQDSVPNFLVEQTVISLLKNERLYLEKGDRVYLPAYHKYEVGVAKHLLRLRGPKFVKQSAVRQIIEDFEYLQRQNRKISRLEDEQKEAILKAASHQLSVVTGPPGSGKTTIIQGIIYTLEKLAGRPLHVGLAAPTGKAARRMAETTGRTAFTIHKLLGYRPQNGHWEFAYNEHHRLPCDLIIIDECSMLDVHLAYHLFQAIAKGTTVVLVGDKDQLDSVGPGRIFGDILESNQIPTTYLKKVHRLGGSALERALMVRDGFVPDLSDACDFVFFEHEDELTLQERVLEEFVQAARLYGLDEVVVLTPMNKTLFGVHELNKLIQREINPPAPGKAEVKFGQQIFRVGDKVIQKAPNDAHGLVNGQIGYVKAYIPEDPQAGEEERLIVDFDGEEVEYTRDRFDEIQLAYAMTVHRAQGSEWSKVIMPVFKEHFFMLTRRLIYTLWTRMKKQLFLFGAKDALIRAIRTNRERPRNSLLKDRIRGLVV
jgi:helicase, putative, RecD/TraA family